MIVELSKLGTRRCARPVYEAAEGTLVPPLSTYQNAGPVRCIDIHADILPFFGGADKRMALR